jgi:4-hydroxy-4-methyl-2-oxoglutarate aldolase
MGGQSALVAQTCGFAGAIINGAVRDVPAIREIGYPIWAAGVTPITGKFRMEAMEMNGPVVVHDIVVYPGDLVVADDSGLCVVPQDLVVKLIDEAESVGGAEDHMRELIRSKAPLSQLRPFFRKRYS